MKRIWKVKKKTKSALSILLKAQKMGGEMLQNGVGPDLKKMKQRRMDPEEHIRKVALWAKYAIKMSGTKESLDWWIEPNGKKPAIRSEGHSFFRIHDLATSEVWKFQPNFDDPKVGGKIAREKMRFICKKMSDRFLYCWVRTNVAGQNQAMKHIMILDLATKRQHWLFENERFGPVQFTISFEFDRTRSKLQFECIHSHSLESGRWSLGHMMTAVCYEVSVPDFTTTIVSTNEMTLDNYWATRYS